MMDTAAEAVPADVTEHLGRCPACARFAERLMAVRQELVQPRPAIEPGPGFVSRVVASCDRPRNLLGWAALRLLPVALALTLVLGLACLRALPVSESDQVVSAPSDDVVLWVADLTENDG